MNHILNYIQISESISTSGQPTIKQLQTIAENKFEVVINLALNTSDNALDNEYFIVTSLGMNYFHIPVSWEHPEKNKVELFLLTLEALEKQNKKIYIHCAMNYRVSMFMYIYKKKILKQDNIDLISLDGFEPNEIWKKFIRENI